MILFIINIFKNSRESIQNIENILEHGHSVFIFIDGSNEDFQYLSGIAYPKDRLKIICAPENVGLFWARVSAWRFAKKHFDIGKFSYVNFLDGGEDQLDVQNVWDFDEWTTDVVETNCQFSSETKPKYDGKGHSWIDRLSPSQGFLAGAMINNVWNKYIRPDVLDRALTKLDPLRLNFAEDIVFVGLVCLESRSWCFLNRVTYIYENTGASMSRPEKLEDHLSNVSELKKAINLVSSYFPRKRFEINVLFWLMLVRNKVGINHKRRLGLRSSTSKISKAEIIFRTLKSRVLRLGYAIVVYCFVCVLIFRDTRMVESRH